MVLFSLQHVTQFLSSQTKRTRRDLNKTSHPSTQQGRLRQLWFYAVQMCFKYHYCLLGVLNLKEVKKVTNHARSHWFHLGIELDIDLHTLKVSVVNV